MGIQRNPEVLCPVPFTITIHFSGPVNLDPASNWINVFGSQTPRQQSEEPTSLHAVRCCEHPSFLRSQHPSWVPRPTPTSGAVADVSVVSSWTGLPTGLGPPGSVASQASGRVRVSLPEDSPQLNRLLGCVGISFTNAHNTRVLSFPSVRTTCEVLSICMF